MGGGLARPQLLRLGMFGIVVLIHLQYILAPNEDQGFINSPMGLPLVAIWLLGKVQSLKFAIQELVYG